jgi:hypothetical protein
MAGVARMLPLPWLSPQTRDVAMGNPAPVGSSRGKSFGTGLEPAERAGLGRAGGAPARQFGMD